MSILVGDVAGHLGAATAEALLRHGQRVVGLVEPAPGADPALRRARLGHLSLLQGFGFAAEELAATGLPSDLAGVVQLIDTAPAPTPAVLAARLARQLDLLELCARLRPLPHLVQVVIRPSHGQRVAEGGELACEPGDLLEGACAFALEVADKHCFPNWWATSTADPDLTKDLLMMVATKFSAAGLLTADAMGFIGTLVQTLRRRRYQPHRSGGSGGRRSVVLAAAHPVCYSGDVYLPGRQKEG